MNKDKIIVIIIVVLTLFLVAMLYQVLAKYRDNANANINAKVANWNIKVNNETIGNKTQLENSITPTFDHSDYVKEGVIAPGVTGYYDITIDASDTDVSFTYTIINEADQTSLVKDLVITDYQIGEGEKVACNGTITGEIIHNTAQTKIRVYIKWDDSESASMDNTEDTAAGISAEDAKILVRMNFVQKR